MGASCSSVASAFSAFIKSASASFSIGAAFSSWRGLLLRRLSVASASSAFIKSASASFSIGAAFSSWPGYARESKGAPTADHVGIHPLSILGD